MKQYIALMMPLHKQGSIIGIADSLDELIWTDDVMVINIVNGDLYRYENEAWQIKGSLNEEEYNIEQLVAATLGYA